MKERLRVKNWLKFDLWIEKKIIIVFVSILLKYLFSRFDLFIIMWILRVIKIKGGGGVNNIEFDGEVYCEEGVYCFKVWN